jgi:hypothetical protein
MTDPDPADLENRMRKACTHFRGEAHSFLCFAGMVEDSGAEKCSEKALSLAADDVFGKYGMRSTPTSALEVMLVLPPLHLFIKQEVR